MFKRSAAAIVVLSVGLIPFIGSGSIASASSSAWTPTATQALPLASATNLGKLTSTAPIQISVALRLNNQSRLNSYIAAISTPGNAEYGQSLTPAQFASQYGPTGAQVQTVESYLSQKGFQNLSVSTNKIYVTGSATPAVIDSAFNSQLNSFMQKGTTVYANVRPAMVPSSLAGDVVSIIGLTNATKMQFPATPKTEVTPPNTPSTNVPNSFWAPGFQKGYDATGTAPATKTAIAIMAEGNVTGVVKDLRLYEKDPNNDTCTTVKGKTTCTPLPQVPVTVEQVGVPSSDTAGQVEFDMDTQTSTGLAGSVKTLYIYDATSLTDSDVALEFNKFVSQDLAKAGSASFGECEYAAYLDGFMVANDEVLNEGAAQGQTLFASAGDSGGFCAVTGATNGVPGGEPDVNYPASSPYVVAVGGTTLVTNTNGTYGEELAWVAGGGGPSYFEYQPAWQSGVAPPTGDSCQVQSPVCLARDLPDISMDADFLLAAANFYNAGSQTSNGGTSLASPLALGSWARIETARNNTVGFASPTLYAEAGTAGFHDVTLGDTGPYPALPGWDYATGNGSFDIAGMIKVLSQKPVTPALTPVPTPACNLFFGDETANPIGSTSNNDALSLEAGGIWTDATHKTLTGVLRVKSLSDSPAGTPEISGTGDQWYFEFDYKGTEYFLSAAYDPSTIAATKSPTGFAFGYGTIGKLATGGTQFNPVGSATGSIDVAHGLIYITAPWTDLGMPALKSVLSNPGAATYEQIGSNTTGGLLESGDSAGSTSSYVVGTACAAKK